MTEKYSACVVFFIGDFVTSYLLKCKIMGNYSELLKDPRWQKKRLRVLERDEFTCQECFSGENTLHVHHLRYGKGYPWDVPDVWLVTLCESCHAFEEDAKSHDLYDIMAKAGITRWSTKRLLDHVAFIVHKNLEDNNGKAFWALHNEVLRKLIDTDTLDEFIAFRDGKTLEKNG